MTICHFGSFGDMILIYHTVNTKKHALIVMSYACIIFVIIWIIFTLISISRLLSFTIIRLGYKETDSALLISTLLSHRVDSCLASLNPSEVHYCLLLLLFSLLLLLLLFYHYHYLSKNDRVVVVLIFEPFFYVQSVRCNLNLKFMSLF